MPGEGGAVAKRSALCRCRLVLFHPVADNQWFSSVRYAGLWHRIQRIIDRCTLCSNSTFRNTVVVIVEKYHQCPHIRWRGRIVGCMQVKHVEFLLILWIFDSDRRIILFDQIESSRGKRQRQILEKRTRLIQIAVCRSDQYRKGLTLFLPTLYCY